MSTEEFVAQVGREPETWDLQRVQCNQAGQVGHRFCGVCQHRRPVFACPECLLARGLVDVTASTVN